MRHVEPVAKADAHCAVCHGARIRAAYRINGYSIFRCSNCRFRFVSSPPGFTETGPLYDSPQYYAESIARRGRIEWDIERRLRVLDRLAPRKGRLLDVGCAAGFFLSAVKAEGWDVMGVEWSRHIAEKALQLVGKRVIVASFETAEIEGPFDVICLWDVIEHSQNPVRLLEKVVSLLRKGGLVCVSTPNMGSLLARFMGEKFPGLMPPEHLSYFSARPLKFLCSRLGLRTVKALSFSNIGPREFHNGLVKYYLAAAKGKEHWGLRAFSFGAWVLLHPLIRMADLLKLGSELELYLEK